MTSEQDPNLEEAAHHYAAFLKALGIDGNTTATLRVASLIAEWTCNARPEHATPPELSLFEAPLPPDWVTLQNLSFYSFCVHHMVPFFGHLDIAYLPDQNIVGFNSIARLIDHYSRMPQLQEQLTGQIADALETSLSPRAVLVRIRARQLCMEMRSASGPVTCSSFAARGQCTSPDHRAYALQLLNS